MCEWVASHALKEEEEEEGEEEGSLAALHDKSEGGDPVKALEEEEKEAGVVEKARVHKATRARMLEQTTERILTRWVCFCAQERGENWKGKASIRGYEVMKVTPFLFWRVSSS
jgi:hypothetical protein